MWKIEFGKHQKISDLNQDFTIQKYMIKLVALMLFFSMQVHQQNKLIQKIHFFFLILDEARSETHVIIHIPNLQFNLQFNNTIPIFINFKNILNFLYLEEKKKLKIQK